jgi:hypothetical protein
MCPLILAHWGGIAGRIPFAMIGAILRGNLDVLLARS